MGLFYYFIVYELPKTNVMQCNEMQSHTMRYVTRLQIKYTCLAVCAFKGRLTVAFIAIRLVNTESIVLARRAGAFINVDLAC